MTHPSSFSSLSVIHSVIATSVIAHNKNLAMFLADDLQSAIMAAARGDQSQSQSVTVTVTAGLVMMRMTHPDA